MTTFADTETPLDLTVVEPEYDAGMSLADRFAAFHHANPAVLRAIEARVARLIETGPARFGIELAYAPLRYDLAVVSGTEPKLNNNHRSYYSRLLVRLHPDWADRLTFRACDADELPEEWWTALSSAH